MAIPRDTWRHFYKYHEPYFNGINPNHGAQSSYGDGSLILYEPPQVSNGWLGANAPPPAPIILQVPPPPPIIIPGPPIPPVRIPPPPPPPVRPRSDFPLDPGDPMNTVNLPTLLHPQSTPGVGDSNAFKGFMSRLQGIASFRSFAKTNQVVQHQAENGTWHRDRSLGSGGFRRVYCWVLRDANNNIVDRVAIKDANIWPSWGDITAWSTDARATPREVAAQRTLRAFPTRPENAASRFILGYRGHRVEKRYKCYRVATEVAELGDLVDVAWSFMPDTDNFRQRNGRLGRPLSGPQIESEDHPDYEPMPEHFIWRMFGAIVQAVQHMHNKGLVHRDLKPDNIFMTRTNTTDDPMMGDWGLRPLIGDFGATMPLNPLRFENPTDFDNVNSRAYTAPEIFVGIPPLVPDLTNPDFGVPQDEKSDVFSIGVTIWSMMLSGNIPLDKAIWPDPLPLDWNLYEDDMVVDVGTRIIKWMATPGSGGYALHTRWHTELAPGVPLLLTDLISDCLEFRPEQRPTLAELLRRIQDWLNTHPEPAAVGAAATRTKFDHWFGHLG